MTKKLSDAPLVKLEYCIRRVEFLEKQMELVKRKEARLETKIDKVEKKYYPELQKLRSDMFRT